MSERWGKGVRRAVDSCVSYGFGQPEVPEMDDRIGVVLYKRGSEHVTAHIGRPHSTVKKATSRLKIKGVLSRNVSKSKCQWMVKR